MYYNVKNVSQKIILSYSKNNNKAVRNNIWAQNNLNVSDKSAKVSRESKTTKQQKFNSTISAMHLFHQGTPRRGK